MAIYEGRAGLFRLWRGSKSRISNGPHGAVMTPMSSPAKRSDPWNGWNGRPSIVFDWAIHFVCNYRCHYCWFDRRWQELSAEVRRPPPDLLAKRWEEVYRKHGICSIQISGGEPTIYPDFLEVATGAARFHHLSITSNFSRPVDFFRRFAARVAANHCHFTASYHPQFSTFEDFIAKIRIARDAGNSLAIVCVAWPPLMEELVRARDRFAAEGFSNFRAQPFNGPLAGREYPRDYSDDERALIRRVNGEEDLFQKNQTTYLLNESKTRGRLCTSGQKYVHLSADGTLYRCNLDHRVSLGNFFDGEYVLFDQPKPCDMEHCTCEWLWLVDEKKKLERSFSGRPDPFEAAE